MAKDPTIELVLPAAGIVTQGFGENPAYWAKWNQPGHPGYDIAVAKGTQIVAMTGGVVQKIGFEANGYGNYIKLQHQTTRGIYYTLYAHLTRATVTKGQSVAKNAVIGLSGSTGNSSGPHIHVELQIPWDTEPGYRYYVANIEKYFTPGITGGIVDIIDPVLPGVHLQPGTMIVNTPMTNVRLGASLGSKILATVAKGTIFQYAGEYRDAEGRRWRIGHVFIADELVDEAEPKAAVIN